MEQGMEMLFALFGGLAMFLYGMDRMSRALQRAAGDAMKRLLARLTATPLLGVLTGLAVTAVLQSSSAATVIVIGFVSAGLLELPRAVAVIYGINIGTTMTAQLIAFDVQTLVYPVLFLGFLLDFAARRPRWQAVGEAVFSFGLLFEGIDILGRALQPLAGQAVFLEWMTRVKESPLLGILLGLSMTMVVQSSSATIALLQNVARQARAGRHPQRAGPCRGGAGPSGRQHRHDGHGPAGLHRAGEGRRPRRAGPQLLQPQREPAGGGAAALVRPAGGAYLPQRPGAGSHFPADRQRPHRLQRLLRPALAAVFALDGAVGVCAGAGRSITENARCDASGVLLLLDYALPIHRKGDDSRQHFRDPEGVPDAGGAELAAEQPR